MQRLPMRNGHQDVQAALKRPGNMPAELHAAGNVAHMQRLPIGWRLSQRDRKLKERTP